MKEDDIKYLAHAIFGDGEVWPQVLKQRDAWNFFGLVWGWATKQEWWLEWVSHFDADSHNDAFDMIDVSLINPYRFPELVVDFLREREKGE